MFAYELEQLITHKVIPAGVTDGEVISAMKKVPRYKFVPTVMQRYAYLDFALAIGYGQTISAPSLVGIMTQALELTGIERVLEIGTGSGYQTAILAELCYQVISIERIPELANEAATRLHSLGYENITILCQDGSLGYPEQSPYDAVIVTAAAKDAIPQPLIEQMKVGGRIVIPVGNNHLVQTLKVGRRQKQLDPSQPAQVKIQKLLPVRFVPLIGQHAWSADQLAED